MAFVSVLDIASENGKRNFKRSIAIKAQISFAHDLGHFVNTPSGRSRTTKLRLTISPKLMKSYGLVSGDRVELLFDQEAYVGLIRKSNSGAKLCVYKNATYGAVAFPYYPGMPSVKDAQECNQVEVHGDGIYFEIPACASFTENLREADLMRPKRGTPEASPAKQATLKFKTKG